MQTARKRNTLIIAVAVSETAALVIFSHASTLFSQTSGEPVVTITSSDSYTVTYPDGSTLAGVGDEVGAGTGWTQQVLDNYYDAYSTAQDAINSTAAAIASNGIETGIDETDAGDVLSVSCTNGGTLSLESTSAPPITNAPAPSTPITPNCPLGYVAQNRECVFTSCPSGYTEQMDSDGNPECVQSGCSAGYICHDGGLYYENSSCAVSTNSVETCSYGCQNGACLQPPSPEIALWNVKPTLVQSGQTATVSWSAQSVASCRVSGTNGDSWTSLSGDETSGRITSQTTYSIFCQGLPGASPATAASSTVVNIAPEYQEL